MDSRPLELELVEGSCKYPHETSCSIEGWELVDQLSGSKLLKDCNLWCCLCMHFVFYKCMLRV
jgi:hypothetical protein